MKNKSKRKKISLQGKKEKQVLHQWFFMSECMVSARNIYEIYKEEEQADAELWEAAGVVEIMFPDGTYFDFEWTQTELGDTYSNQYLEEHKIKSLFYVTVGSDDFEFVKREMKRIVQAEGGFFCGDTQDFQPIVR